MRASPTHLLEAAMPKTITVELDTDVADMLEMQCKDINTAFKDTWTPETLAASFLRHVLIDDFECHCWETLH